jgi:hypothetical protein
MRTRSAEPPSGGGGADKPRRHVTSRDVRGSAPRTHRASEGQVGKPACCDPQTKERVCLWDIHRCTSAIRHILVLREDGAHLDTHSDARKAPR